MVGRLPCILVGILLVVSSPAIACPSGSPPRDPQQQSEHMARGVAHFERALYGLIPQHRDTEATGELNLAVAAFKEELRRDPDSADAHRYLGRLFLLRGQAKTAAAHFDRLRTLRPTDPDACGLAASAWADAGRFDLARARLLEARERTSDPKALAMLDEFLVKLDERAAAAVTKEGR